MEDSRDQHKALQVVQLAKIGVRFGKIERAIRASLFQLDLEETLEIRNAANVRRVTPAFEKRGADLEEPVSRIAVAEEKEVF